MARDREGRYEDRRRGGPRFERGGQGGDARRGGGRDGPWDHGGQRRGGGRWEGGRDDRGRGRPFQDRGPGPRERGGRPSPEPALPPGKEAVPLGHNTYMVPEGTRSRPATVSLVPGVQVYEERLVQFQGKELRVWDPFRSKFSAAILRGCSAEVFGPRTRVLYLGAASGTTVSHLSDIVDEGVVYAVEFAPRSMRDLFRVAERRRNVVPILADARAPWRYADLVGPVDVVYQDVAQPDQADIAVANVRAFMPEGTLVLMVKARSVDVSAQPTRVFADQMAVLKRAGLGITGTWHLSPFERDHAAIVARAG